MVNSSDIPTVNVYFNPTAISQGDGSYIIKPGKPILGREKITIREARRRYGMSKQTWARLYDAGLVEGGRPTPRKTFLFVDSVEKHIAASNDPEFWNKEKSTALRKAGLSKKVNGRKCSS